MEYLLLIIGFILLLLGILGSLIPALPGPPLSWIGLLCIYLIKEISFNYWILGFTLLLTVIIVVLDFVLPAQGTKRFGGTKYGIWGTNIGLVFGLFFPPFGFVLGPFFGAFIGEIMNNSKDAKGSFRAAFGSLLGFLASTFMKLIFSLMLFGVFLVVFFSNLSIWF
jgi:hypothetical protein